MRRPHSAGTGVPSPAVRAGKGVGIDVGRIDRGSLFHVVSREDGSTDIDYRVSARINSRGKVNHRHYSADSASDLEVPVLEIYSNGDSDADKRLQKMRKRVSFDVRKADDSVIGLSAHMESVPFGEREALPTIQQHDQLTFNSDKYSRPLLKKSPKSGTKRRPKESSFKRAVDAPAPSPYAQFAQPGIPFQGTFASNHVLYDSITADFRSTEDTGSIFGRDLVWGNTNKNNMPAYSHEMKPILKSKPNVPIKLNLPELSKRGDASTISDEIKTRADRDRSADEGNGLKSPPLSHDETPIRVKHPYYTPITSRVQQATFNSNTRAAPVWSPEMALERYGGEKRSLFNVSDF